MHNDQTTGKIIHPAGLRKACRQSITQWKGTMEQRLLQIIDAAVYLGMSKGALYQLVHRKHIPVVRIGRALRFDKESLNRWIAEHQN